MVQNQILNTMRNIQFDDTYLMNILQADTGWLCTFLGGAQDKLTERESALKTIGLLGGGSGTSAKPQKTMSSNSKVDGKTFFTQLIACQCTFFLCTNFSF